MVDEIGIPISVCHFPPGTSKWNKVEHRLFSFISSNWRGEPLRDYETVVRLIAGTTMAKGRLWYVGLIDGNTQEDAKLMMRKWRKLISFRINSMANGTIEFNQAKTSHGKFNLLTTT